MTRKIDLHVHTKASDGLYTPEEIIDYAIENGISTLAITDHDTIGGLQEGLAYAAKIGFDLIPGVEFNLDYHDGSFHLVGLFVDHCNTELINATERLKKSRLLRVSRMVESLNSYGYAVCIEEIEEEALGASIGKPHIARVLVRKGYAKDMTCVFKDFMVKGKPGHAGRERISLDEAVCVIKNSGGIPIVAHPKSLNYKSFGDFENMLVDFIKRGVMGIEVYSSMHTMSEVSEFLKIAKKRNILVSGGSDFHGDKGKAIGVYTDGTFIPDSIIDDIRKFTQGK